MSRIAGPQVGALAPPPDHLSFSQVTRLASRYRLACPRQWAYTRLMGLDAGMSAGMICGRAIDRGVQTYFGSRIGGASAITALALAQHDCAVQLENADWPDPDKAQRYSCAVKDGLDVFCDAYVAVVPASVQERHEFTVRGEDGELVTVFGYSDWIDAEGVIVDLKWSGTRRWNDAGEWDQAFLAEKRDQLAVYWMARRAERQRMTSASIVAPASEIPGAVPVVPRGRIVVVYGGLRVKTPQVRSVDIDLTEADIERLVADIREADTIAKSGVHPARPGEPCSFCSFVDRCRVDSARTAPRTEALV